MKENESRYSRQEILPEIRESGQKKIEKATIAIIGLGALGTVAAELLARAGIGTLMLIDRDCIEQTNLQRQILYREKDIGRSKAIVAAERLEEINSKIKIMPSAIHVNSENITPLRNVDLILDCTDNIETRLLLNDFCKKEKKKWIYGAAIKTKGFCAFFEPNGPCFRCFMQEAALETCETAGVLNTITTTIAAFQTTLAIQSIIGERMEKKLYYFDSWKHIFRTLTLKRNKDCPVCRGKYVFLNKKEDAQLIKFCSTGRFQFKAKKINFALLKKRWKNLGPVEEDGQTLSFRDLLLFKDGRILIKAKTEEEAKILFSKWIGN